MGVAIIGFLAGAGERERMVATSFKRERREDSGGTSRVWDRRRGR